MGGWGVDACLRAGMDGVLLMAVLVSVRCACILRFHGGGWWLTVLSLWELCLGFDAGGIVGRLYSVRLHCGPLCILSPLLLSSQAEEERSIKSFPGGIGEMWKCASLSLSLISHSPVMSVSHPPSQSIGITPSSSLTFSQYPLSLPFSPSFFLLFALSSLSLSLYCFLPL